MLATSATLNLTSGLIFAATCKHHHNQKALQVPVVKKEADVVKKPKQEKVDDACVEEGKEDPGCESGEEGEERVVLTVKEEVAPVTKN